MYSLRECTWGCLIRGAVATALSPRTASVAPEIGSFTSAGKRLPPTGSINVECVRCSLASKPVLSRATADVICSRRGSLVKLQYFERGGPGLCRFQAISVSTTFLQHLSAVQGVKRFMIDLRMHGYDFWSI